MSAQETSVTAPAASDQGDGEVEDLAPPEDGNLPARRGEAPPNVLVIFPLHRSVPFPGLFMPVTAEAGAETEIMEKALAQGRHIGLLLRPGSKGAGDYKAAEFAKVGVLAEVQKRLRLPDGNSNYLCKGLRRCAVERFAKEGPVPVARVSYPEEVYPPGKETEALARAVLMVAQKVAKHQPNLDDSFSLAALNMDSAGALADFVAAYLMKDTAEKQQVLESFDVRERLRLVDEALTRELVMLELGDRIQTEIRQKVEKQQKEYFLREQVRIIRRELGEEVEPQERDKGVFLKRLEEREFPEEVRAKVKEEAERLGTIPPMSPEYPVVRNYLEWLTELPWKVSSVDRIDLQRAERILERDHYGLKEAKERILEFLGVRKMKPEHTGPILCLVGPPGVGKTSLGMAIAESTGRRFERMSLGGMRDEAEIKGHRRTYVGALPGRILQMIRRAGTNNPVIVLDEIDKVGKDFRGDPASALLEVLDPAQNNAFLDFYMDIPFDLSKVLFLATANSLHTIPPALLDRMEVLELPGYITAEKVQIARRHLLPRQLRQHGLDAARLRLAPETIRAIINGYTREAGVRGLEKALASLCRKRTLELARGKRPRPEFTVADLAKYLGPAKYLEDRLDLSPEVGVALGLAYTPYGGDVLAIECVRYPGSGKVAFTGSLGDVMIESCRIAHAYLRSHAAQFGLKTEDFDKSDLHVHFPAGAVPKDGPSAGIAITCAMLSRLTGRRLRARVGMTGELTLVGDVLPIGGVREKVLTAKRRRIRTVILPVENARDVQLLDPAWTAGLEFRYVRRLDDALGTAFPAPLLARSRAR
ncbi:MAG: endopeptidase La [Planctomycetota bacterium]|nr:MAG: endopeptidase La [Planctomycetota bacterium]